jgi:hypothetical protein
MDEDEQVVSWRAVTAHCPVIDVEGKTIGTVLDVAALPEKDIFHGIIFRRAGGEAIVAPAAVVDRITDRAVYLTVGGDDTGQFETFHQPMAERLGLVGHFFWKHLGWTDDAS